VYLGYLEKDSTMLGHVSEILAGGDRGTTSIGTLTAARE